jgi:hypothetical protein
MSSFLKLTNKSHFLVLIALISESRLEHDEDARNQMVSGSLVASMMVPAVTVAWWPHCRH